MGGRGCPPIFFPQRLGYMKAITYNYWPLVSFYGFLLPLFFCACSADVQKNEEKKHELHFKPVVVEAEGFAVPNEGLAHPIMHRSALRDARRNAIVQAHVIINTNTYIKGGKVENDIRHFRSAGYVEWMQIMEAGLIPRASPPIYRVRVKACVYPMQRLERETLFGSLIVPSTPSVVLKVSSNLSENRYHTIRPLLATSLSRCGLNILPSGNSEFAVELEVNIDGEPPEDPLNIVITWKVGDSKQKFDEPTSFPYGQIQCADYPSQTNKIWQMAGLEIAQDVFQTWITPRKTHFVFKSIHMEALDKIAAEFGPDAETRKEKDQNGLEMNIIVPAAGNSLYLANSVLKVVGQEHQFEADQISFRQLVFTGKDSE